MPRERAITLSSRPWRHRPGLRRCVRCRDADIRWFCGGRPQGRPRSARPCHGARSSHNRCRDGRAGQARSGQAHEDAAVPGCGTALPSFRSCEAKPPVIAAGERGLQDKACRHRFDAAVSCRQKPARDGMLTRAVTAASSEDQADRRERPFARRARRTRRPPTVAMRDRKP